MNRKDELKQAKLDYKHALKNKVLYEERRNNLLRALLDSEIPKWGNLKVIVTPL